MKSTENKTLQKMFLGKGVNIWGCSNKVIKTSTTLTDQICINLTRNRSHKQSKCENETLETHWVSLSVGESVLAVISNK